MKSNVKIQIRNLINVVQLLCKTSPFLLIVFMVTGLLRGIEPLINALILKRIIDLIGSNDIISEAIKKIIVIIVIKVLLSLTSTILNNVNHVLEHLTGQKLKFHFDLLISSKIEKIKLEQFDDSSFKDQLANAKSGLDINCINTLQSLIRGIEIMISLISFGAILAKFNIWLTLFIIISTIPSMFINLKYNNISLLFMISHTPLKRKMQYFCNLATNENNLKENRIFNLFDYFREKYFTLFDAFYKDSKKLIVKESMIKSLGILLYNLVSLGVYFFITVQAVKGSITIGNFTLYASAIFSVQGASCSLWSTLSTIQNAINRFMEGTKFIDNITEDYDFSMGEKLPRVGQYSIEFRNVYFKYKGMQNWVLNNLSCKINAGQSIALIGLNGAGKTTFLKLLMGLYEPQEGAIFINGVDINLYKKKELWNIFSPIFQDYKHYSLSLRENIAISDIENLEDTNKVLDAADKSGVMDFIGDFPNSLETQLTRGFDHNGKELSQGQWQKVALARAFFNHECIYILDEPTSAMDVKTEHEIFERFNELREGHTTIFVSHRLSSATIADKIILIENGRVEEEGTHEELIQNGNKYKEYFSMQAERYQK